MDCQIIVQCLNAGDQHLYYLIIKILLIGDAMLVRYILAHFFVFDEISEMVGQILENEVHVYYFGIRVFVID